MVYDYHDGSIHDLAIRTHFQRGYEEFKVGLLFNDAKPIASTVFDSFSTGPLIQSCRSLVNKL